VFCVFEDHIYTFVFQDYFVKMDDIFMSEFAVKLWRKHRLAKNHALPCGDRNRLAAISRHADCDIPV
jgi:hypothetical protein